MSVRSRLKSFSSEKIRWKSTVEEWPRVSALPTTASGTFFSQMTCRTSLAFVGSDVRKLLEGGDEGWTVRKKVLAAWLKKGEARLEPKCSFSAIQILAARIPSRGPVPTFNSPREVQLLSLL